MLERMLKNIMEDIKKNYPHVASPAAMKAVITSVKKTSETYGIDMVIIEKDTGKEKECTLKQSYYLYSVRVIDNDGNPIDNYPTIPNIKSRDVYNVGDTVTVVFTGGELYASIAGG